MFKDGFDQPSTCKQINAQAEDPLATEISGEQKEQAHSGLLDYLEYIQRLSVAELLGKRRRQEDRFKYGLAPKDYFALPVELRFSMFKNICQMLQHDITEQIPKLIPSRGTCVLMTVAQQIENQVQIDMAHIGDSLAFLIIEDDKQNVAHFIRLNHSLHHATDPEETARILSRGGKIEQGRIAGDLTLSRDIGNNRFESVLHREPDFVTKVFTLEKNQKAKVLVCCDGLPERYQKSTYGTFESDEKYVEFLYSQCKNVPFEKIPYHLAELALKDGSTDNITCSIAEISDCFFKVVFDGHGGPQVAECARNLIVPICNRAYTQCLASQIPPPKEKTPETTQPLPSCTPPPEADAIIAKRKSVSVSEFDRRDIERTKFFKRTHSATSVTALTTLPQSTPPESNEVQAPTIKAPRTE